MMFLTLYSYTNKRIEFLSLKKRFLNSNTLLNTLNGANVVAYWVKPLPMRPAFHMDTGSCPGCPTFDPAPFYGLQKSVRKAPLFRLLPPLWETWRKLPAPFGPALVTVTIREVN